MTTLLTFIISIWLTAPALVFSTVEFTSTPLLDGKIIPFTPAQTAERIIAPRLCESSTPSRITTEVNSLEFFSIKSSKSSYLTGYIWAIIP